MADQLPITVKLVKRGNELVSESTLDNAQLKLFVQNLEEGDIVQTTYEVLGTDGSYAQLSKLHKHIRELAGFTGESFESMKLQVKLRAGLNTGPNFKSFSDCSKEELSQAIQVTIEIGEFVGFSLY
jgi:hypothetical protein